MNPEFTPFDTPETIFLKLSAQSAPSLRNVPWCIYGNEGDAEYMRRDLVAPLAALDARDAQIARLQARVEELEPFEPHLKSLDFEDGIESRVLVAQHLMQGAVEAFRALNGDANYTESEFVLEWRPALIREGQPTGSDGPWRVTVQTPGKPTPHQLRRQAEEELAQERAAHAALKERSRWREEQQDA